MAADEIVHATYHMCSYYTRRTPILSVMVIPVYTQTPSNSF